MIKSIIKLSVFCVFFTASTIQAQTNAGRLQLSAGIGLVPTFVADDANVNVPPVSLRAGYHITPAIGISAYAGYASYTSNTPLIISDGKFTQVDNKQYLLGLRGEIRKDVSEKLDFYGGGMLGYNHTSTREFDPATGETHVREITGPSPFDPNEKDGKFLYSGFVGGTYYLKQGVGMFLEAGYGVSMLNTGITVRL